MKILNLLNRTLIVNNMDFILNLKETQLWSQYHLFLKYSCELIMSPTTTKKQKPMSLTFQQHRHVNNDIEHHAIFKAMQDTHCYFENNAF